MEKKTIENKGHSLRVASYSLKIAKEMGLSDDEKKKIRLAALLHDIGQILYDELIDKPTKLSDAEFELIKKHPLQGATILIIEKLYPS